MAIRARSCGVSVALLLAGGCAAIPPPAQLTECLQPNRRVDVEVSGIAAKALEGPQSAVKAAKPVARPIRFLAHAQGDSAFDVGAAVLKVQGTSEFDRLTEEIAKRKVHVGSIVVLGHSDKLEAERFGLHLSEDRAKAVVAYLASKGLDRSLMYWEGKGANDPLPVTRFCD